MPISCPEHEVTLSVKTSFKPLQIQTKITIKRHSRERKHAKISYPYACSKRQTCLVSPTFTFDIYVSERSK